jgi:hypothetical protein
MITVQQLVDNARVRHAAFMRVAFPDGALLLFLNQYQREKLLELAGSIEALLGQAKQVATVIAGALVGSDAGVPYYITTSGDGWPVSSDAGVPYVDFTQPAIALDPFGQSGGQPGFPLPAEFIKLIHITAQSLYDSQMKVDIVSESRRGSTPQRDLQVFVSGNRLVPNRVGVAPYSDRWLDVTSVTLSYVAMQTLAAMTDVITLPLQLVSVLEAALAERLAFACEASDKVNTAYFVQQRKDAEARIIDLADSILNEVTTSHVEFRG